MHFENLVVLSFLIIFQGRYYLEIPTNIHNKFKDYSLAREIKNIPENMLSNYKKYLNDKLNIKYSAKDKKLILDLLPKKIIRYIIKI